MLKIIVIISFISFSEITFCQSDFAVGLNGNINFPNGKFTEFFEIGYGGDVHFLYLFGNASIFSLSIGYNRFALDLEDFNSKANEAGINARFDIESNFSSIPILIGVKWYFLKQKTGSPYIMIEAGYYNYNFTFSGTAEVNTSGENEIVDLPEINESGTEPMLRISAGYLLYIQRHWFIDASVNYSVLIDAFTVNDPVDPEDSEAAYSNAQTLNYISLTAGINYRF
jgi:outer membrane protein W